MEYEVLWGDGPLGLTLRPDLGEDMPPVVGRITRLDSAAALAKVAVGDMLVSINGIDTARQGYDHVVDLLQKIPRPATLRFRVPRQASAGSSSAMGIPKMSSGALVRERSMVKQPRSSTASTSSVSSVGSNGSMPRSKNEQYTIVWTEGPLGMILRPDDDDVHVPCIRKITGKGAGTGMERAAVGDVLVAVNGQETKSLGFRSTISLLKTIRKPAVLKFKRMHRRLSRRRSSREDGAMPPPSPLVPTSTSMSAMPTTSSSSSRDYGAYDIVWREGDLGLKLKPGHNDVPVLSKLTGKGTASGIQNANVGDELVSVNGMLVDGKAYHDTLRMLKHSQKPAVLRFRPSKDRRISMMSMASTRSNPSTAREVERVRSGHVPIYDTGRSATPPTSSTSPPPTSHRRDASGERVKKKKRIPLNVAKELVAASQGIELEHAIFAGMPITAIEEHTREAHLLRVEAKACITAKAEKNRTGLPPKEALQRAEQEARVLQEALEKVKDQAKKYEQLLEAQKRDAVLASATRNKSQDIIGKQNNVIAELSGVIAGFRRDSYSEMDIVPLSLEEEKHRQDLMDDLQSVLNIPAVVPVTKYCAECGATDSMSKLEMDDDGQYYCKDCWDKFYGEPGEEVVEFPAPVQKEDVAAPPVLAKTESATGLTRISSLDREEEEKNARLEAEKKLQELRELTRTGSMRSIERQTSLNAADRTQRERRGLEELAQALKEEEERARAEGNLALAKKLSAQRARTMAESEQQKNGDYPEPDFSKYMNGQGSKSFDSDSELLSVPPPVTLKRAVTLDSPYSSAKPLDVNPPAPVAPAAPAASNDYDDVNTDDEAEDQVEMSEEDDDVLREVEDRNYALAKQLGEAHSVIERARMSIMLSGDDAGEDVSEGLGLSDEQINLFKKLTSQADERASTVDRLHPPDESDSDSDGSGAENEGGDEEEEDDDGVWI